MIDEHYLNLTEKLGQTISEIQKEGKKLGFSDEQIKQDILCELVEYFGVCNSDCYYPIN